MNFVLQHPLFGSSTSIQSGTSIGKFIPVKLWCRRAWLPEDKQL